MIGSWKHQNSFKIVTNIDGIAKEQYSQNKKEIKKEMFSKETKGIHTRGKMVIKHI